MRTSSIHAAIVITSMLCASSAFAQAPAAAPTPPATAASADDKKVGIGVDAQLVLPVGDLKKGTGPLIGALVRVGYRVTPPLELTGRLGYLAGLTKEQPIDPLLGTIKTSISDIPIWLGARYFFMEPKAGLYGGAELALNVLSTRTTINGTGTGKNLVREGFNAGVGYVISKDLPIDIRVQYSMFNLLGQEKAKETTLMGLGISAGYTFSF